MKGEFFDIETSVAKGKLSFQDKHLKRNHLLEVLFLLIGLILFGGTLIYIGLEKILSPQSADLSQWVYYALLLLGIPLIILGMLAPGLSKKLRVIENNNSHIDSFEAMKLALSKLDYRINESEQQEVSADRVIIIENATWKFHGFVRNNKIYFATYKEYRGGISLWSVIGKPLGAHEFEEFFEAAVNSLNHR